MRPNVEHRTFNTLQGRRKHGDVGEQYDDVVWNVKLLQICLKYSNNSRGLVFEIRPLK